MTWLRRDPSSVDHDEAFDEFEEGIGVKWLRGLLQQFIFLTHKRHLPAEQRVPRTGRDVPCSCQVGKGGVLRSGRYMPAGHIANMRCESDRVFGRTDLHALKDIRTILEARTSGIQAQRPIRFYFWCGPTSGRLIGRHKHVVRFGLTRGCRSKHKSQ